MDLQSIFYLVAIIFMLILIAMAVSVIVAVWIIQKKVSDLKTNAVDKVQSFISDSGPGIISTAGISVAGFLFRSLMSRFRDKRDS